MLADATLPVPASLMTLLAGLAPLFTAPSFRTFCGLACGFLAQTGKRTVCGMLAGASLSQLWPHDRAHRFFSRARWSADDLGLAAARLVAALLVPAVAIDGTVFKRRGKKARAASWFHDGSAAGPDKTGYGSNRVIAAVVVRLPILSRPVAIPVLAKLVIKGTSSASRLWLAPHGRGHRRRAARAGHPRGRRRRLRREGTDGTPGRHHLDHPAAQGRRAVRSPASPDRPAGRPRTRGDKLPSPARLAATAAFVPVTVTRYGKTAIVHAAAVTCLWYGVFGSRPVQVVPIRDTPATGYDVALVTTDPGAGLTQVIERYAARWSIEVAIGDARQVFGAGQARNRTARAVERTVPFPLACQAIATTWYATAGHHPADAEDHRARAPRHTTKAQPSTAGMAAKLRRVLIAARFRPPQPDQPTLEEINVIRLAREELAA